MIFILFCAFVVAMVQGWEKTNAEMEVSKYWAPRKYIAWKVFSYLFLAAILLFALALFFASSRV